MVGGPDRGLMLAFLVAAVGLAAGGGHEAQIGGGDGAGGDFVALGTADREVPILHGAPNAKGSAATALVIVEWHGLLFSLKRKMAGAARGG